MEPAAIHPEVERVLAFHRALDQDNPVALTMLCTVHVESSQDGLTTTGVDGLLPWLRDTGRSGTPLAVYQTGLPGTWVLEARTAGGNLESTLVQLQGGLVARVSRHPTPEEAAAAAGTAISGTVWTAAA